MSEILDSKDLELNGLALSLEIEEDGMLNILRDGKRKGQVRVVDPVVVDVFAERNYGDGSE